MKLDELYEVFSDQLTKEASSIKRISKSLLGRMENVAKPSDKIIFSDLRNLTDNVVKGEAGGKLTPGIKKIKDTINLRKVPLREANSDFQKMLTMGSKILPQNWKKFFSDQALNMGNNPIENRKAVLSGIRNFNKATKGKKDLSFEEIKNLTSGSFA